jgi:acetate kinase
VSRILVVNAGSSSLKLRVVGDDGALVHSADLPGGEAGTAAFAGAVEAFGHVDAAGHRVVHGGTRFTAPVRLDDEVVAAIRDLTPLAPLHQPPAIAAIDASRAALPDVPQVACFDTAFHATLPPAASTYAVPHEWRERWGVRRFGFHGLSHAYAARRVAELLDRAGDPRLRVVTAHLGAGASLTAVLGGRSVDTTMGFTPLEGLVMATRSGTVDPGLLLWLAAEQGVTASELTDALEWRSGLRGLGGTEDMRAILAKAGDGDEDARLALDVYVHRLRALTAAMAASLGGVDAIAFTGGVGERSAPVRALAAEGLRFLGVGLDAAANEGATGDRDVEIGDAGSAVRTFVIPAREEVEVARGVRAALRVHVPLDAGAAGAG